MEARRGAARGQISEWRGRRWPFGRGLSRAALAVSIFLVGAAAAAGCKSPSDGQESEAALEDEGGESSESEERADDDSDEGEDRESPDEEDPYVQERERMVEQQIAGRDVEDSDVLEAMRTVPRHEFVPERLQSRAYSDGPLPIGHDQTISQPYIVAAMTEALEVKPDHKVLEIGTGSGYQAAVLAEMVDQLYTIEIVCELAERAEAVLDEEGYDNVEVRCGDGYKGWPEEEPFDRIIVTAAPPELPDALVEQLAPGGRMVVPVGERVQHLKVITKDDEGRVEQTDKMPVRFVPMVPGEE
ncbi:MAG: protein-L-isoaspartate(D-aspartate) O-methyltransferase [Persicimonas sp.]